MRSIITGAAFLELAAGESFSGKFLRPVLREKDSPDGSQKAGSIMGYEFADVHGDIHIVGASHQIEKALTAEGEGIGNFYKITFMGKEETSNGKPFNRYKVDAYNDEKEFVAVNSTTKKEPETEQGESEDFTEPKKATKKATKKK